mgnify:CR=1 FL=1
MPDATISRSGSRKPVSLSPLLFSLKKGLGYEKETISVGRNRGGFKQLFMVVRDRDITLKLGKQDYTFKGMQYLLNFAQPNFYFHVTTAYDILRHNGVEIGKAEPKLAIGQPTFGWVEAAFRSMELVASEEFAQGIETPVLLIGAAHDKLVHPGADLVLITRIKRGMYVLLKCEHEIMMERDEIRRGFWACFDPFVATAANRAHAPFRQITPLPRSPGIA